ncbi:hypothetical protein GCM10027053_12030 [Intrasporangium mesophilum]
MTVAAWVCPDGYEKPCADVRAAAVGGLVLSSPSLIVVFSRALPPTVTASQSASRLRRASMQAMHVAVVSTTMVRPLPSAVTQVALACTQAWWAVYA